VVKGGNPKLSERNVGERTLLGEVGKKEKLEKKKQRINKGDVGGREVPLGFQTSEGFGRKKRLQRKKELNPGTFLYDRGSTIKIDWSGSTVSAGTVSIGGREDE